MFHAHNRHYQSVFNVLLKIQVLVYGYIGLERIIALKENRYRRKRVYRTKFNVLLVFSCQVSDYFLFFKQIYCLLYITKDKSDFNLYFCII